MNKIRLLYYSEFSSSSILMINAANASHRIGIVHMNRDMEADNDKSIFT